MLERIKCGTVNCYLLRGSGGSILVDTGNSWDAARIYQRVKDKNVRLIVLTHGHPDHIGGASKLAGLLQVFVAMSRGDAELLANPATRSLSAHTFTGSLLARASKRTLRSQQETKLVPDIWLEDGMELWEYGISARVILLSGHTKGSMGLLTEKGVFLVGDALFNILRPTAALLYEDREEMERSVETIARSGGRLLCPGHGRPFAREEIRLGKLSYWRKGGRTNER